MSIREWMKNDDSPCRDCPFYAKCDTDEQACEAFVAYVMSDTVPPPCWYAEKFGHRPSGEWYEIVFAEEYATMNGRRLWRITEHLSRRNRMAYMRDYPAHAQRIAESPSSMDGVKIS